MLADGSIDGATFSTLVPVPHLLEASQSNELVVLKIDEQILQNLSEKYHYELTTIQAESYPFLKEDIATICSHTIVIVPKNCPDITAYKIAAAITENIDYLKTVHDSLASLTPEKLVTNTGIPLHPGAEKYYRENGIIQ